MIYEVLNTADYFHHFSWFPQISSSAWFPGDQNKIKVFRFYIQNWPNIFPSDIFWSVISPVWGSGLSPPQTTSTSLNMQTRMGRFQVRRKEVVTDKKVWNPKFLRLTFTRPIIFLLTKSKVPALCFNIKTPKWWICKCFDRKFRPVHFVTSWL